MIYAITKPVEDSNNRKKIVNFIELTKEEALSHAVEDRDDVNVLSIDVFEKIILNNHMLIENGKIMKTDYSAYLFDVDDNYDLDNLKALKIISDIINMMFVHNAKTNGVDSFKALTTREGKAIDYGLCLNLENGEMMESTPYAHWKNLNAGMDDANIKIELIDMVHFVTSIMNIQTMQFTKAYGDLTSSRHAELVLSAFLDIDVCDTVLDNLDDNASSSNVVLNKHHALRSLYIDISKYSIDIMSTGDYRRRDILVNTARILAKIFYTYSTLYDMDMQDVKNLYVGKNVLNGFRLDHGYKNGQYKKIWNGAEDNVAMTEIIDVKKGKECTKEEIYALLEEVYSTVKE